MFVTEACWTSCSFKLTSKLYKTKAIENFYMIKNLHFFWLPVGVDIVVGFVVSVDCDEIAKTEGFQDLSTAHSILVSFYLQEAKFYSSFNQIL